MKILKHKSKLAALAAVPLIAVVFALVAGTLTQQAVAAPTQYHAFAVGGFTAATFPNLSHVAFAAQIVVKNWIPNYSGHVVQEDASGVSRHGPVDCVVISGSQAVVVWHVTHSDDPNQVPNEVRSFEVFDGGEPPAGMDTYSDRQTDSNCGFGFVGFQSVLRGNIVVKTQ